MECNLTDDIILILFYFSNWTVKKNYCKNICFLHWINSQGEMYIDSAGFYITYIINKIFFFILFIWCTRWSRDWDDSTCQAKRVWDGSKCRGTGADVGGEAWEKWPEGEAGAAKAAQEEEEKSEGDQHLKDSGYPAFLLIHSQKY